MYLPWEKNMGRLECDCGRIMWNNESRCPSCGRPAAFAHPTNREYGSERAPEVPPPSPDAALSRYVAALLASIEVKPVAVKQPRRWWQFWRKG